MANWLWKTQLAFCMALISCSSSAPHEEIQSLLPPSETHQIVTDLASGIAFSLPPNWIEKETDYQRVFSGPQGSASYFNTITLQQVSTQWHESPYAALEELMSQSRDLQYRYLTTQSIVLGGSQGTHPALLYSTQLRHHRERFRRMGLLITIYDQLFEIQYTAPESTFESSYPVFDSLLASLTIEP